MKQLAKKARNPDLSLKNFTEQVCGREGYVGWSGYGGSVMQWNPTLKIGFGYVPFDQFIPTDIDCVRAKRLQ